MLDTTKYAKYGYEIKKSYLNNGGDFGISTIIVVMYRPERGDYMWAYAYHPEDGSWGNGHYDYTSLDSAVKDLKKDYPYAKPVKIADVLRVESENGSFGKYDNIDKALARAYHIAKVRNVTTYIADYKGLQFLKIKFDAKQAKCYVFELIGNKRSFRLYANGTTSLIR